MMSDAFIKRFDDPYSLSRESQILDLLGQRLAPVPRVYSIDSASMVLRMERIGTDLGTWLDVLEHTPVDQWRAAQVLAKSVEVAFQVCEMGVFHLDLAARNFLVQETGAGSGVQVFLTDFGLAVTQNLPAQKPLWIRPDPNLHHPALEKAIVEDWKGFFARHQLPLPTQWASDFEIPLSAYRQDWAGNMAVDRLGLPWCVVAHGLGRMLQSCAAQPALSGQISSILGVEALRLLNGTDEAACKSNLGQLAATLYGSGRAGTPKPISAAHGRGTPRPSSVMEVALPSTNLNEPGSNTAERSELRISSTGASEIREISEISSGQNFAAVIRFMAMTVLIAIGYGIIDAAYWAYGLLISTTALWILGSGLLLTLITFASGLQRPSFTSRLCRGAAVQGCVIIALSGELLGSGVPLAQCLVVTIVGLVSVLLGWGHKGHGQTPLERTS